MSTDCERDVISEINGALGTKFASFHILSDGLRAAITEEEYREPNKMIQIFDSYLRALSCRLRRILVDQYPEHLYFFKSLSLSPEIRIEHAFTKEQLNEYTHIFVDVWNNRKAMNKEKKRKV